MNGDTTQNLIQVFEELIIWEVSLLITSHFFRFRHVITQKCNPNFKILLSYWPLDFESQNFAIFDKVVHNFGKSDVKKCLFLLDAYNKSLVNATFGS